MYGLEHIFDKVRGRGLRIAFPECDDVRILRAAGKLRDSDLACPVLVGEPDAVGAALERESIRVEGIAVLSPADRERIAAMAALVAAQRPKLTPAMAARLVSKPAYFAGGLLALGEVAAMVAGVSMPTRRVIEASTMTVGLAGEVNTPSSFFIMVLEGREPLIFADCALNVSPTAEQLADIAIASARSRARILGGRPLTAFLSFSTLGSGAGPSVELVREAMLLAAGRAPDLEFSGELQADAAIVPDVAEKKGAGGAVAGHANVLVFPDLNSGNIAYKLVQRLAGAEAVGPFLQGFAKPVSDLSRGASTDDVVTTAVVALASSIDD